MGGNSGNLLYANAVVRALSTRWTRIDTGGFDAHTQEDPSKFIKDVNRTYDHYVVPLANVFRSGFTDKLVKMTEIIRRLEIPVTVVGIGAQTTVTAAESDELRMTKTGKTRVPDEEVARRHDQVVRTFVETVLERSATFGVRGEVTKRYLVSLGIPDERVTVIGCPSLFTWGSDLRIEKTPGPLTRESRISMNVDYRVKGMADVVELNSELYPELTSPVQDSKSARMIITGVDKYDMSKFDSRLPIHTGHRLYKERRLVFYPSPWGWIESFKSQRFAFGTRLHGNIAALLAGTPVHLLAHDSRTLELARYHAIPHSLLSDFEKPPSAAELWERTDVEPFNQLQPERFRNYLDFMHTNGLRTVFDKDRSPRGFDRKIAEGQRTGPVLPQ
ncbi:polysaccharide pyruvyl transferase family protein [Melissospora conviva]